MNFNNLHEGEYNTMIQIGKRTERNTSVFDLDGIPTLEKALPLSLQHLLTMIVGNVTPALIVAGATGVGAKETTLLVQASFLIAGLATLMQLYPLWRVGSGLPMVIGVSFTYVPTLIAIGASYGIEAIFGAQLVGGLVAILFGAFLKPMRKLFPPLVAGTVVFSIGLSLYPTAVTYMAGGSGAVDFGSPINWMLAIITLIVVLFCNHFTKGYFKLASILIGIIVGYIVAAVLGKVDFSPLVEASWVQAPTLLPFGIKFVPSAIIAISVIYIVNSVEAVGDLSAITEGGLSREAKDTEISGGIIASGIASSIGILFGGLPTATYSQNVGIVAMTKVISKFIVMLAATFMLIAAFIPKFGALMTTVPQSVLGGANIVVFAMITMTGIKIIIKDELSSRNVSIVGLSVALGMGITQVPGVLDAFPSGISMVFGSSPVVITTLSVILLNLILPKKTIEEEEIERNAIEN